MVSTRVSLEKATPGEEGRYREVDLWLWDYGATGDGVPGFANPARRVQSIGFASSGPRAEGRHAAEVMKLHSG